MAAIGSTPAGELVNRDMTLIVWDIEKCPFPKYCKPEDVLEMIKYSVSYWGYKGPAKMLAIGDIRIIPRLTRRALGDDGTIFKHSDCDHGPSRAQVLTHMMSWLMQNPPPANIIYISKGRFFTDPFRVLEEEYGYKVIRLQESPWSQTQRYTVRPSGGDPRRYEKQIVADYVWNWEAIACGQPVILGGGVTDAVDVSHG